MALIKGEPLFLNGNDDEPEQAVRRKNTYTGQLEAAAGLTGMRVRLSATKDGDTIHPTLDVLTLERGNLPGTYYGIFQGTDLDAYLTAGTTVYQIFGNDLDIHYVVQRKVVETRSDTHP